MTVLLSCILYLLNNSRWRSRSTLKILTLLGIRESLLLIELSNALQVPQSLRYPTNIIEFQLFFALSISIWLYSLYSHLSLLFAVLVVSLFVIVSKNLSPDGVSISFVVVQVDCCMSLLCWAISSFAFSKKLSTLDVVPQAERVVQKIIKMTIRV